MLAVRERGAWSRRWRSSWAVAGSLESEIPHGSFLDRTNIKTNNG